MIFPSITLLTRPVFFSKIRKSLGPKNTILVEKSNLDVTISVLRFGSVSITWSAVSNSFSIEDDGICKEVNCTLNTPYFSIKINSEFVCKEIIWIQFRKIKNILLYPKITALTNIKLFCILDKQSKY